MLGRHRIKFSLLAILGIACFWLFLAVTGYPPALKPDQNSPTTVVIENVRLITMAPGRPQIESGRTVIVRDGVIEKIIAHDAPRVVPTGSLYIDGEGRTLLPGLIDAHVHVWDEAELAGYLAHGVTGVRNMSGMPFHLPLAKQIEQGNILGPDLLTTGPILNSPGPNQQDNHQLVITAEEARTAVREQHEAGYRHIKIYSNLLPAPYEAILEEADMLDMSVSGHTPEGKRTFDEDGLVSFEIQFLDTLDDDFTTIEHTESIFWHGLYDQFDQNGMAALARQIAATDSAVTPTLVAHANLIRVANSDGAYLERPGTATINPALKMLDQGTYDYWSAADPEPREIPRAAFYLKATKMMADAGVPIVAGSDAGIFTNIPGESLHDELDLLVTAGLTPHEAIRTATITPANILGFEDRGQIRPGYNANLLLVEGDPLEDITALRQITGVMVRGVWLDQEKLAELHNGASQTSFLRSLRRIGVMLLTL